jgi:DNA-binding winged helix-turn-helix (wHTH) protein
MTGQEADCRYRFGGFELQPTERRLLADGQMVLINERAFDVLVTLVERAGHPVTNYELLERV